MWVPFFSFYLGLKREPKKEKVQKGTTGEPRDSKNRGVLSKTYYIRLKKKKELGLLTHNQLRTVKV